MNAVVISFIGYSALTLIITSWTVFQAKKYIRQLIQNYPNLLEQILPDERELSMVRKGYGFHSLTRQDLQPLLDAKSRATLQQILLLQNISLALIAGLAVWIVIVLLLMPAPSRG